MYKLIIETFSLIKRENVNYTIVVLVLSQLTTFLEIVSISLVPIIAINLIDQNKIINFFEEKNLNFLNTIVQIDNL